MKNFTAIFRLLIFPLFFFERVSLFQKSSMNFSTAERKGRNNVFGLALFMLLFGFANTLHAGATDDSYSVDQGATVNANVLSNDAGWFERNHAVTTTGSFTTSKGNYTLSSNGSLSYTANASATGTDSFDYEISYQSWVLLGWIDRTDTATVTITINATIPTVPVSEYHMDECAWDGSNNEVMDSVGTVPGRSFNGANTNTGTADRIVCNSAYFDGVDDYVSMGDSFNNIFGNTNDTFTITAWIKPETLNNITSNHNTANTFIAKASDNKNDNLEIGITPGGKLHLYLDTDNGPQGDKGDFGSGITVGNWHFIAVSYDGSEVSVTINGTRTTNSSWSGNLRNANGSPFTIGTTLHSDTSFNGLVDEVKIYNTALSATEINTIYTNENAGNTYTGTPRTCQTCVTPTISISGNSIVEGDSGTSTLNFPVTLTSPAPIGGVTVEYATSDLTAAASSDYIEKSDTLTITAGNQTGTISVVINGDTTLESDETFVVTLSNSINAILGTATATGTILNDDAPTNTPTVSLSCDPSSLDEGDSGTQTVTCTVTIDAAPNTEDLKLNIRTNNGTARSQNDDYESLNENFSFTRNTTTLSQTFLVTVNGDTDIEPDETFNVEVHDDSTDKDQPFTLPGQVTITIRDDDGGGAEPSECPTGANESFREFCLRKKITVPGNMVTIGNTVLVAPTTQDKNICSTYKNGSYTSDASNTNADYYLCQYWDDASRPSTSATIDSSHIPNPAKSTVEWAGLYWQAIVDNDDDVTDMTIKIKNGDDNYEEVGYDKLDWGDGVGKSGYISYSAFKDVTEIFNSNNWLDGKYTVADIPVQEGKISTLGSYGAWTLVLIYRNDKEKLRNFSVFDGWKRLQGTTGNNEAIINIAGFYTPKQAPINSSVSVFAAEGDKNIEGDYLYAKNANHNDTYEILSHTTKQTFNSAIVPGDFTRTPNPVNNQGIDIQTFQLGTDGKNFLEPTQSNIDFKFITKTTGNSKDTYFPSMIAFNTELYAPKLCYDYAYSQYGRYFTEDNNGSFDPYIVGDGLSTSEDIVVELFIRNEEESDTDATNMTVHITDINASQATYVPDSALVTFPGSVFPEQATPNPLQNIYIGTVGGKEYFSIDYDLDPVGSSINMPIKVELEYTLELSDSSGNLVPIDFKTVLNENVPLCTENNFAYYPDYSIFNVENSALSATQKYNLPTQTANRAGDFKVIAYERGNVHTRIGVSMPVAVELIDANKYHDIKASCVEPDSALTPRVWVIFDNNATAVNFDKSAIDTAIETGAVSDQILNWDDPMTEAEDYYNFVKENVAFRVAYNATDSGTNITLVPDDCQGQQVAPCYRVEGFSDLSSLDVGSGAGNCNQDMDDKPNSTDRITQYCGNAGSKGLDSVHLAQCMECIYGGNTRYICSRDNFAIRPESFRIALHDQDQNGPDKLFIASNDDPSKAHSSGNADRIVAGYNYYAEINATNHQNDNATPGYYTSFKVDGNEGARTFQLKWSSFTGDTTYCNDVTDHNKTTTFYNGYTDLNLTNYEIGKYDLNLFDKLWTRVDWDSDYRSHHVVNASYFVNGSDCRDDSSFVPAQSSATAAFLDDMSGCDISTTNHTNSDYNSLKYTDLPLHIFPYQFDHSGIFPRVGPSSRMNGQTFIYMDTPPTLDVDNTDMSYNMNGTFFAAGYDNGRLSNFVTGCYADDINMDLYYTYNSPPPATAPYLWYSIKNYNPTDGTVYRPASGTDEFDRPAEPVASILPLTITQGETFFAKDMNGSITMDLGYNFKRDFNKPINPRDITFEDFNITYVTNPANIRADLKTGALGDIFEINGTKPLNTDVTFVYGRAKPSQDFYDDVTTNSINTPISIVVYCDQDPITCSAVYNIEDAALRKTEAFDWYLSRGHVMTPDNDGNITLSANNGAAVSSPVDINNSDGVDPNVVVSDGGVATRPLEVNIDFGAGTDRWLIYNKDINIIPSPFYRVRFIGNSDWAGHGDTGHVVGGNTNTKKNRRLGW